MFIPYLRGLLLMAALFYTTVCLSNSSHYSIIVVGDMPYNMKENAMLSAPDGSLYRAIRASSAKFLIHTGDIKAGGRACSDQRLLAKKAQIMALLPSKVAYTPGDNEWTDCDRMGQYELERLAFIRKHFTGPDSGVQPQHSTLEQQQSVPENYRWHDQDIGFINAHIPGTNFGRNEILSGHAPTVIAYADTRLKQLEQWLQHSFSAYQDKKAIILSFHADIFTLAGKVRPDCTIKRPDRCDGYIPIRAMIKRYALAYGKPVLLIHGDTEDVCLQQVITANNAPIWRLNAAGDGIADALEVSIDLDQKVPFYASLLLRESGLPQKCYVNARL